MTPIHDLARGRPRPRLGKRLRTVGGWLPGALTLGNLLAGFGAILMAMQDRFWVAFWLIVAAAVLDGLDGRLARLTGTASSFGGQLDSLCDAVSFAVAPSLVAFQMGVGTLGRFGWAACFLYVACGVIRLARFNIASQGREHDDFIGLPSPFAAALVAAPALFWAEGPGWPGLSAAHAMLLVLAGLLMVSRVRYPSFKTLRFGPKPYRVLALWAVVLTVFIVAAEWVAPLLVLGYLVLPIFKSLTDRVLGESRAVVTDESDHEESAGDGAGGRRSIF
ncbi:MAG: CDP-diacylglycerol--serine O-phosphatidyltransferase [Acidobacteriota bacterium]|nr:CDP-diacylglycerol--serine O-phosphatidyltransferase [Acidobacteriota bacterium]